MGSANAKGALFIIIAMLCFAGEDLSIKFTSQRLPVGQILFCLGLLASGYFLLQILIQRAPLFARHHWTPLLLMRSVFEGLSAVTYTTALSQVDVALVASVFQATPLVTTVVAAVVLKEQVGWRRWLAVSIGLIGVLIILRPGVDAFEPAALIVIITCFCIAGRDLITARMGENVSSAVISLQAMVGVVISGALLLFLLGTPPVPMSGDDMFNVTLATAFGVAGYLAIIAGLRIGETSAVMPFRYTRLVFSIIGGMIIFAERPDTLTYVGSALILTAGIYTFWREHQLAKA